MILKYLDAEGTLVKLDLDQFEIIRCVIKDHHLIVVWKPDSKQPLYVTGVRVPIIKITNMEDVHKYDKLTYDVS